MTRDEGKQFTIIGKERERCDKGVKTITMLYLVRLVILSAISVHSINRSLLSLDWR